MNINIDTQNNKQEHPIFSLRRLLNTHLFSCSLLRTGGFLLGGAILGVSLSSQITKALLLEQDDVRMMMIGALVMLTLGIGLMITGAIKTGGKNRTPAYFFKYREILIAIDTIDAVYVERAKNDGSVVNPELVAFNNLNQVSLRDIDQLVSLKRKLQLTVDKLRYLDELESTYQWLKDSGAEPTKLELKALQKAITDKK